MKHEKLINNVMKMLLTNKDYPVKELILQYKNSEMEYIESSEYGFYANFKINNLNLKLKNDHYQSFYLGNVDGSINNIPSAVGFVLFIKNGFINMLEGYTVSIDKWPSNDDLILLNYDE